MKIGALSAKTGLSIQAIRFYERKTLLSKPERTQSNYRSYSDEALQQLMFIKQCRALDMTIEEISLVLEARANPENSCQDINETIDKHIENIEHRVDELKVLQKKLVSIRSNCASDTKIKECGVLHKLDSIVEVQSASKSNS
ncbi:Cd(II)/Pb(II)-responsive transcriptional regulator [Glaciecola petra]|uniref:Cd(II)/Pb(II)-responsive transcriptional regulator n=1 Tax=Glaciecola petra TaxID=3075602 RepID=A0ABU2ZT52_9ALTE|nr:Cd(II)/Pb(II)-responsive transcriptional regulator [Aestuariibacter sp. P117]MDT0595436.1 Cd(II)/Pb(II)-responsive transcriptional regulator [Aestuariibacter sp. P117]